MKYLLAVVIIIMVSCAPTYQNLPNHVQLASNDVDLVKKAIASDWVGKGFVLQGSDDLSITFSKQMGEQEAVFYKAALGNSFTYTPEWNYKLTFVLLGGGKMDVFYNIFFNVPNAFGAVERHDVTWEQPGKNLNDYLMGINNTLSFNKDLESKGRIGVQSNNRIVQRVAAGTPADTGGIKVGDEIISVNDSALNGEYRHDVMLLSGAPESVAGIKLVRNTDTLFVNLVRKKFDAK